MFIRGEDPYKRIPEILAHQKTPRKFPTMNSLETILTISLLYHNISG